MPLLTETGGLEMTLNDDGSVTLRWDLPTDDDRKIEEDEVEALEEGAAPF